MHFLWKTLCKKCGQKCGKSGKAFDHNINAFRLLSHTPYKVLRAIEKTVKKNFAIAGNIDF